MSGTLARTLRAPLPFLLTVVATLAITVGAAAAIFTLVNAFLLSSLPYQDSDEMVMVWRVPTSGAASEEKIPLSPGTFTDLRERTRSFSEVAGLISDWATVSDADDLQRVRLMAVVGDFFELMRTPAARGRVLREEDTRPGAPPVVVIGHGFWQRQYAGDPGVVGQIVTIGGQQREIVGVLPEDFRFIESLVAEDRRFSQSVDLWLPYDLGSSAHRRGFHYIYALGRLAPGASMTTARRELDRLTESAAERFPETERGYGLQLVSLHEEIFGHLRSTLWTLLGAAGVVLLIACANLATLLLARARSSHRDVAIRMAVGADRQRIIRESLVESVGLSLVGGILALVVAQGVTEVLTTFSPVRVLRSYPPDVDVVVIAFTVLVAIGAGLLFGGLPAFWASRIDVASAQREGTHQATRRSRSVYAALVMVQIALATTLLIGTGLSLRTYVGLIRADVGFDMEDVVTFDLHLPRSQYREEARKAALFRDLSGRISALPGVESVGLNYALPFSGVDPSNGFEIEGRTPREGESLSANLGLVNAGYFETLGILLLEGRGFRRSDDPGAAPVAVIDERMAERYFEEQDPLGRRIRIAGGEMATIVGVVGAVQQDALEEPTRPYVYLPIAQRSYLSTSVAVKTSREQPLAMAGDLRRVAAEFDLPISNVSTLEQAYEEGIAPQRFSFLLIGCLGSLALFLALVGTYSVMSYLAAQRRREVGIRMALGADKRDVFWLFAREGLALSLLGTAIGLGLALGVERLLESLVHGIATLDAVVFVVVPVAILLAAFFAYFRPALAISRVDPNRALRWA